MAAEKRPFTPNRTPDVAGQARRGPDADHLSIEEKYDEVRQLISIGKEKGYLLYDEVNEMLPSEITSSDELDDLFNTFGSAGIEVIDSDQKYLRDDVKPIDRTAEGAEELELDLLGAFTGPIDRLLVARVFLIGVDDFDARAAERVEEIVELFRRGDFRRKQFVDLVVEKVALLLADADQLADFVVLFFNRQRFSFVRGQDVSSSMR